MLENLQAVCAAAGASLADAVKITVYLRDMADFAAVNEVYGSFSESDPPARVAIAVAGLPRDAQVEMDAIVALPELARERAAAGRCAAPPPRASRRRRCGRRPRGATGRRARSRDRGQLDRLGQVVEPAPTGDDESLAEAIDALVVVGLVRVQLLAGGARGERAWRSSRTSWSAPSNVPGARRCSWWPNSSGRCWCSVPPSGDVEELHAAADCRAAGSRARARGRVSAISNASRSGTVDASRDASSAL